MERAPLLAIHMAARPVDHHEPIPHNEMAAKAKLSAEGALEEQKIFWDGTLTFGDLPFLSPRTSSLLGRNPSTVCYSLRKQLRKSSSN
jgi:hypothetical protein